MNAASGEWSKLECPKCGNDESLWGLADGRAECGWCRSTFSPPTAATPEQAEFYAKMSIEWRGYALATEKTSGLRAAQWEHGIANLYASMVPEEPEPDTQMSLLPDAQRAIS